jgi:serine/threonine protein kinase
VRGWFGPFRLERQVGRGGLGAVYRAIDTRTGATIALKMLPPGSDPSAARRLDREFEALRNLHHPNIVRVLDLGEVESVPWLSMEFVDGMVVRDWLKVVSEPQLLEPMPEGGDAPEGVDLDVLFEEPDSGALLAVAKARRFKLETGIEAMLTEEEQVEQNNPDRLVALCESLAQVCDGLSFIHERGLLHRDVKPSNILVTRERRAVLVDFGLAKRVWDDRITDHGRVVGTYRYMSPEQARGEPLDRRSDLYAVGATLYDLIAGRPPFMHANQLQLLEAIAGSEPPELTRINPGAPEALAGLTRRLLSKRAEDRPEHASEVSLLLRAIGRGFYGFSEPLFVRPPREVGSQ